VPLLKLLSSPAPGQSIKSSRKGLRVEWGKDDVCESLPFDDKLFRCIVWRFFPLGQRGGEGLEQAGRKSLFLGMFTDIKYFLISLAHTH